MKPSFMSFYRLGAQDLNFQWRGICLPELRWRFEPQRSIPNHFCHRCDKCAVGSAFGQFQAVRFCVLQRSISEWPQDAALDDGCLFCIACLSDSLASVLLTGIQFVPNMFC